jgi:hypothetical protein
VKTEKKPPRQKIVKGPLDAYLPGDLRRFGGSAGVYFSPR